MSPRSSGFSEPRPGSSCFTRPNRPRKKLLPSSKPGACASLSCLTSRRLSLSGRDGLWLAVGDQGMDVLYRQSRIGLIKPDRTAVCARRKVKELLPVLSAWRWRWLLRELESGVAALANI